MVLKVPGPTVAVLSRNLLEMQSQKISVFYQAILILNSLRTIGLEESWEDGLKINPAFAKTWHSV